VVRFFAVSTVDAFMAPLGIGGERIGGPLVRRSWAGCARTPGNVRACAGTAIFLIGILDGSM